MLTVLVFAHRRPRFLRYVLEGLKRQNALSQTQVWLDGHHDDRALKQKVLDCQSLRENYPEATWIFQGARSGVEKLMVVALSRIVEKDEDVLILEDDCYPAEDALHAIAQKLDEIRDNPKVFSVYGHHFGNEVGATETSAFQCWGWATTAKKLKPILSEFKRLWLMAEPEALEWTRANMTDEIKDAMDVYEGRSSSRTLFQRFCWDTTIAFLVARAGMFNRSTGKQVIFNFGMGCDSGHFAVLESRFLEPPFNICPEARLVERFNLPDPGVFRVDANSNSEIRFDCNGNGLPLLEVGWSRPENWGVWSLGERSRLRLDLSDVQGDVTFTFKVCSLAAKLEYPLQIGISVNDVAIDEWILSKDVQKSSMDFTVPASVLAQKSPACVEFTYQGAASPAALGISEDNRVLAIGLESMLVRQLVDSAMV